MKGNSHIINSGSSAFSFDEALKYAEEVAIEYFKNFHFVMQTPQIKQILLDKVESHIKDNEQQVANFLPQFNYIDKKENVKDIVYKIAGKFEISQLLNVADESILFIDDKFYVNGVSNDGQLNVNATKIQHCLKYPLRLNNFKIIDSITEDFKIQADLSFENCEFLDKINLLYYKNESIEHTIKMKNCIFYKEVTMSNKTFKGNVYFNNSVFCDNADFSGVSFQKDVYFHRVIFKKDLQIYRATFERVANFYFATFENMVNFSACVMQNPRFLNFVGVDIKNITQEKMKEYINKKAKDESALKQNKQSNRTEVDLALQHAQNLKDSFRVIKDTLLSQNNLLEAQNWHKLELYANELELECKLEQKYHKNTKQESIKYNKHDYQKFNFLKLCNLIFAPIKKIFIAIDNFPYLMLIKIPYAIFVFFLCCANKLLDMSNIVGLFIKSIKPLDLTKIKIFWQHYIEVYSRLCKTKAKRRNGSELDFTILIDKIILQLYRHTSNHHINFTTILNFTVGMIVIYGLFLLSVNFILPYMANYDGNILSFWIIIVLNVILLAIIKYYIDKTMLYKMSIILLLFFTAIVCALSISLLSPYIHILCFLMIYLVMLGVFYIIFIKSAYYVRAIIYVLLLLILVAKPQLINPFIAIFKTDSITNTELESQILKLNKQDMQILANIALKRIDTNYKDIENPKETIHNNKNILFEFYSKIKKGKEEDYKTILNILESKDLSKENAIISLQNLRDKIFNDNKALNAISNIVVENFSQHIKNNHNAEQAIVNDKNMVIYILHAITNDNILNALKVIYIDKTKIDILKTKNIIYSIILLLCIFSLQKTARKNSIIPS